MVLLRKRIPQNRNLKTAAELGVMHQKRNPGKMKKALIIISSTFFGMFAYIVTFLAFWESWFPYYYHNMISFWFVLGVLGLVIFPLIVTFSKKLYYSNSATFNFYNSYRKITVIFNFFIVVVCVFTFIYMLTHGTFIGGEGSYTN